MYLIFREVGMDDYRYTGNVILSECERGTSEYEELVKLQKALP